MVNYSEWLKIPVRSASGPEVETNMHQFLRDKGPSSRLNSYIYILFWQYSRELKVIDSKMVKN